jgi:DNA primase
MPDNAEIFQKVRDASNIVDIIGEHVALKRAGREFKGLCPFHEDHRPSMAVVPHKQIFHCFVCGTGGDVFKFVKEFHKMSNGEALRFLAQKAGITLPELPRSGRGPGGGGEGPSQKEQIASANEWACSFFQKSLRSPEGKPGLDYLLSRGLTEETLEKFRLGFAPDSWTALCTAALRANNPASTPLSNDLLFTAGLIKKRQDNSPYDLFRNRVMFPILDATGGGGKGNAGRVIAFGGRVLVERRDEAGNITEAKYLNTPETPLFNKSASIYGLHLARQSIIRSRTAVVVEGYMDVIACHQVGITNVIATLGTALTPDHARILKNYAQTIVLIFDSDDAGFRAADRAMEVFVKTPLDIKIASVPDGKDPCDFCIKNGGEPFQKLIDSATDAMAFKWNALKTQFQKSDSVTARQDAIVEFLRFTAASIEGRGGMDAIDPIRRGQLLVRLANLVNLPVNEVTQMLFRLSKLRPTGPAAGPSTEPQAQNVPALNLARTSHSLDALRDAERWLIGFSVNKPEIYELVREHIALDLFTRETVKAELFLEYFENTDVAERTLAGYCGFIEEREAADPIIHAIIEWERAAARWEDLQEFSESIAKLVRSSRQDLGHTPEKVVTDCLQYLIDALEERLQLFKKNSFNEVTLDQHFEDIARAIAKIKAGKNYGAVGYVDPNGSSRKSNFEETRAALKPTGS